MSDYEIRLTRLQGQNLAMDVLASSETAQFLVRAIGQGIWSLAEIDGGVEKLNRFLASEGYTLVKGEVPNKQKVAKAANLSDWNNTKRPAKKKPGKKATLIEDGDVDLISSRPPRASKWPEAKESGEAVKVLIAKHNITDHQLMNDYEFDEDEIKLLKDGEYDQIGRRILFELLNDMRKVLDAPVYQFRPAQMQRSQIVTELKQLIATHTWLTEEELINNFEFGENEYAWIQALDYMKFGVIELRMYLTDIRGAIAERAIETLTTPQGYKA